MVGRARASGPGEGRGGQPRRLGEILGPALDQLATSDQARAYGAWARAAGDQVAGAARPRNFSRGTLSVECTSSVWANELTYLSGEILRRMGAISPGHPVTRLRFTVARSTPKQEIPPAVSKYEPGRRQPAPPELVGARAEAEEVRDERLRAAIDALLRAPGEGPHESSGGSTSSG